MFLFFDPGILLVIFTFIGVTVYYVKKVKSINAQLVSLKSFLAKFKKSDLSFKFNELDAGMLSNPYVASSWSEFKNTLMFSESFSLKNESDDLLFQNISQSVNSIQTTVEPAFFFNEEGLVTSKLNYKFIQTVPTILTGMGPLFTFMHIGIAFAGINFATQQDTLNSVAGLMSSMQAAAVVSVLAVSASLMFLLMERVLYNNWCKIPLQDVQELLGKLFDNISSEKFLIELLRETKIQNNNTKNLLVNMPAQFKTSLDKSLTTILAPYLENILFSLNKIQEKSSSISKKNTDIVDDLF